MQLLPGRGEPQSPRPQPRCGGGAAGTRGAAGPRPRSIVRDGDSTDAPLGPVGAQRVRNKSPHSKLCPMAGTAAGDRHEGLGGAAHAHRATPGLVALPRDQLSLIRF